MMLDYKELVESLRSYSTEMLSYKIDGDFAYAVTTAADAIEQLVADNESYKCAFADFHSEMANYCEKIATLEKECDAAVADLKQASKIPYGGCHLCTSFRTEICKECHRKDMFAEISKNHTDYWEWRGVQETSE